MARLDFLGRVDRLPVLLIAGWWYLRNVQLYGELFGLDTMVAIAGPRATTVLDLVPEFDGFRYSYWALFGAVNIVTFPLAYVIFDLFTLVSVVGAVMWFVRNRRSERFVLLLILAGYVLLVFGGVIRWTMMTPASQGRLMFPAITAISLLMWLGWETIFNVQFSMINDQSSLSNHQRPISNLQLLTSNWGKLRWVMPAFMLIVAVVVPFRDIAPTYAGPQMIERATTAVRSQAAGGGLRRSTATNRLSSWRSRWRDRIRWSSRCTGSASSQLRPITVCS